MIWFLVGLGIGWIIGAYVFGRLAGIVVKKQEDLLDLNRGLSREAREDRSALGALKRAYDAPSPCEAAARHVWPNGQVYVGDPCKCGEWKATYHFWHYRSEPTR